MSEMSLRLVHSRPLAAPAQDFATTLLLSISGLLVQLAFVTTGLAFLA
jgi:hypothetical protein